MNAHVVLNLLLTVFLAVSFHVKALSSHYYDQSCPQADHIVTNAVKKAMSNDKTVPAALLRMHFHDCFVRVPTTYTPHSRHLFNSLLVCFICK